MRNKKEFFNGFTLAELMIVLTVLGIIAAVLTPILFNAMPDERKVRFRKAQYTLSKAVEETLNSSVYDNDTGTLTNTDTDGKLLFCRTMADQLNTVGAVNCTASVAISPSTLNVTSANLATLDTMCGTNSPAIANAAFRTQDGTTWWGGIDDFTGTSEVNGVETQYVVMCMDIDGTGNETPFGFGVRKDGKLIMGQKATTWLQEKASDIIDNR